MAGGWLSVHVIEVVKKDGKTVVRMFGKRAKDVSFINQNHSRNKHISNQVSTTTTTKRTYSSARKKEKRKRRATKREQTLIIVLSQNQKVASFFSNKKKTKSKCRNAVKEEKQHYE